MIAFHTPEPDAPDSSWTPRHRLPKPEPLLRSLAAGLPHNVNTQLLGVIVSLELAMLESGPGTALRDRLQRSLSCALFAAEAVRRLVAYSFHPPGACVPISLRQVAASAARQLHQAGNMHGLMIRL